MSCGKKGPNWTDAETRTFLELITEKSILSIIDGKKYRHIEIFQILVPEMQEKGYVKTAEQMKLKLKKLKAAYFKCKRNNNVSGAAPSTCPFYKELDLLYESRPSTLANSSSNETGIDTAEINNEEDNVNTDSNYTNEETADETQEEENVVPPVKKQRRTKPCGRKSYEMMLQNYNDKFLENQKDLFNSIMNKQMEFQKEMFHNEMIEQRKWEQQELAKEREFQRQQTSMILDVFNKSIQATKSTSTKSEIPSRSTNILKPLKLIPVNFAEPSTFVTTSMKESEERNMKMNGDIRNAEMNFYYETQ